MRGAHFTVLSTVPCLFPVTVLHKEEVNAPIGRGVRLWKKGGTFLPWHLADGTQGTEVGVCSHQLPGTEIYTEALLGSPREDFSQD